MERGEGDEDAGRSLVGRSKYLCRSTLRSRRARHSRNFSVTKRAGDCRCHFLGKREGHTSTLVQPVCVFTQASSCSNDCRSAPPDRMQTPSFREIMHEQMLRSQLLYCYPGDGSGCPASLSPACTFPPSTRHVPVSTPNSFAMGDLIGRYY